MGQLWLVVKQLFGKGPTPKTQTIYCRYPGARNPGTPSGVPALWPENDPYQAGGFGVLADVHIRKQEDAVKRITFTPGE